MAEFPALPLWTDAYLADTLDLRTEEHGIYLILLMLAWRRQDCALPNDMVWLKRSLQACCNSLHGHTFNAIVPKILDRFWTLEDGKWVQKRLQKERKYLSNRSQMNRKAAAERWKNKGKANANGYAPTPTPTPTPNNTPVDIESTGVGTPHLNGAAHTPKVKKMGTRLPEDWQPADQDIQFAFREGLTRDEAQREYEKFCDYWDGKSGKEATKLDWNATFRNWLRRASDDKKNRQFRQQGQFSSKRH